ncbi:type II toxin-antitoxin system RelE family toxin [Nocardiopsis aegyptia]|uniref:mRNA interferase RelE/StbE n=1 Tax=Nocardiopsis aegyptia TaxID=220378 RepID=A0A7Z0EJX0_9ACTN|nr:type II toxin-antitoxin system RelE/ParE family toxin [Nocardiopsis aegyptia]NYJ33327.1 mRNA interferase RelE/StbE [Nocardiopsis aegyptia]
MNGPYSVTFEDQALRQLGKLDKPVRLRIARKVRELAAEPRPAGSIPPKGDTDSWCVRVGDHRIVYTICDGELVVLVLSVAHRREVHRDL